MDVRDVCSVASIELTGNLERDMDSQLAQSIRQNDTTGSHRWRVLVTSLWRRSFSCCRRRPTRSLRIPSRLCMVLPRSWTGTHGRRRRFLAYLSPHFILLADVHAPYLYALASTSSRLWSAGYIHHIPMCPNTPAICIRLSPSRLGTSNPIHELHAPFTLNSTSSNSLAASQCVKIYYECASIYLVLYAKGYDEDPTRARA